MASISEFPFISDEEFAQACHELQQSCDCSVLTDDTNKLTLRFTRTVSSHDKIARTGSNGTWEGEDCVDEVDEEALVTSTGTSSIILVYDIMLSPSYRVPVVYLQLKIGAVSSPIPDVKQLHDMIVPDSRRSAIEATGVYGALSMTDHPTSGLPSYFVHPCRTADALRASSEFGKVSPMDYMMLWFGIVGTSVGLAIPIQTALR